MPRGTATKRATGGKFGSASFAIAATRSDAGSTLLPSELRVESARRMNRPKTFLGLLHRRQCVVPTWRGWLALLLVIGAGSVLIIRNLYGFLAVNDPLPGGILVIEGWSADYVIDSAVEDFRNARYERICLTGGPIDVGHPMREYQTFAEYAKAYCMKLGVPAAALEAIPAPPVERDRSYASALALRQWLQEHGAVDAKINIAGNGAHSRRTRLVYEKALGPRVHVGISNVEEKSFDPNRWWASSAGFRTVLDETIAYAYARLFFSPKPQS